MAETSLPFGTRLWFAWSCLFRVLGDGEFAARVWEVRDPPPRALPPAKGKAARRLEAKRRAAAPDDDDDDDDDDFVPKKKQPGGKSAKRVGDKSAPRDSKSAKAKGGHAEFEPPRKGAKSAKAADAKAAVSKAGPLVKPAPATAIKPALTEKPDATSALQLLALLQREGRLVDFLEQEIATFSDAEIGAATRVVHEGCRRALHEHAKLEPVRPEAEDAKVTLAAGFAPAEVKLTGNVQGKPPYVGTLRHKGWRAREIKLPVPAPGHDATIIAPAEVEL